MPERMTDEELTATLRRMNAETEKFVAEQRKLIEESGKLDAERKKLNRDPWIYALAAMLALLASIGARLPEIIQVLR